MTTDEAGKIMKSLRRYYPNAKIFDAPDRIAAYRERLVQYDYMGIVANARRYVDHNRYFPDLCDLTDGLVAEDADTDRNAWMDEFLPRSDPRGA